MSWEWFDHEPSEEEVLEQLVQFPPIWGIEMAKYVEFVLPMTNRQKMDTAAGVDQYVPVTKLYMQVAGRVKMVNDAAEANAWTVEETQELISLDPIVLRLGVSIESLPDSPFFPTKGVIANGIRYGTARIAGGDSAWEKMETAARGRALGAWGFGVLPGSGIASFEEMQLVGVELTEETRKVKQKSRSKAELIEAVLETRAELASLRGDDLTVLDEGLGEYARKRWNKSVLVDGELDLKSLKDGHLVVMHNDLIQQLKLVQKYEERKVD